MFYERFFEKNDKEKFAIFGFWIFLRDLRKSIQKNTFLLTSVFFILSQNEKKSKIAKKKAKQNIKWLSADNCQKKFFPGLRPGIR